MMVGVLNIIGDSWSGVGVLHFCIVLGYGLIDVCVLVVVFVCVDVVVMEMLLKSVDVGGGGN